jgi:hypothetical protein
MHNKNLAGIVPSLGQQHFLIGERCNFQTVLVQMQEWRHFAPQAKEFLIEMPKDAVVPCGT